jgi:hypothetical protein
MLKFEIRVKNFFPLMVDVHSVLHISSRFLFGGWFADFRSVTLLVLKVPKRPIMLVND